MDTGRLARNLLWMSAEAAHLVRRSSLAVIGCGGNGALFAAYAAHLGFQHFTLCDPDVLETTNLNRHLIASSADLGRPKVEVLGTYLLTRFPDTFVEWVQAPFPNARIFSALDSTTLVIGCLDSAVARISLDLAARKHGRTVVDLGSGFVIDETEGLQRRIVAAGGQILISRPDGACLRCLGFDLEGTQNRYFAPNDVLEASSLLLNGIVAALAVECTINELSPGDQRPNRIAYDRASLTLSSEYRTGRPYCKICDPHARNHVRSIAEGDQLLSLLAGEGITCRTA